MRLAAAGTPSGVQTGSGAWHCRWWPREKPSRARHGSNQNKNGAWRLLAGLVQVWKCGQPFLAAVGKQTKAGKVLGRQQRRAAQQPSAHEVSGSPGCGDGEGLTGRSSSCCPEKCRSGLETFPKVLALHFVAVSHALNIPKALAIVGCRLTVSRLLFVSVVAR